jgi:hypothetical protein
MRIAVCLLLVGCFSPKYKNGDLRCENGKCPSGYHCAVNDTCWKNGSDPEIGDGGGTPDLAGTHFCAFDTDTFENGCILPP